SIVSNLKLRDILCVISSSVRRVMQCDVVSINLQDRATGELKLHALDFPGANGFLREGMVRPPDSGAGMVFSTAQPRTFVLDEAGLPNTSADLKLYVAEGLRSLAYLPLTSHERVLGVLGLGRVHPTPFSQADIDFLMQIASQVAIAVDNALAYGEI